MGTFRVDESHNELGYLEKRIVLFPESDSEQQALDVFEAMFKWGSSVERQEEGKELTITAMVPVPKAATGKSNVGPRDSWDR